MSAQLDSFVREYLGRGIPRATIRAKLREAGWASEEVEAALGEYAEVAFEIPVPKRRAYLSARETFFYLVLFATLYTSAINAGSILFLLVERWLPDPLWGPDTLLEGAARARAATAALVIAFPIFLLVSRTVGGMLAREPAKRGSRIRKWLTYLTLFVAAMVLVGNLIVLVKSLLAGEVTLRFTLKVMAVFLIAGTVFAHYAGDLRREEQATPLPAAPASLLARIAAVACVVVMIAGFVTAGSPREARWRKLDLDRVEALRRISQGVESYRYRYGTIPATLDSVTLVYTPDTFDPSTAVDPVTHERYEYRVLDRGAAKFELCAVFQAADSTGGRGGSFVASRFWNHGAGRHCFQLSAESAWKSGRIPER